MMIDSSNPPSHFFPKFSPQMKAYFWRCLMVEKLSPKETVRRYVSQIPNSRIEQEFVALLVEGVDENLKEFLVVDVIREAV